MKIKRRIDDKGVRALVIEQHRHLLGRPPCGCILQPVPCHCPASHCECPVEVAICGHAEDWEPEEQVAFDDGLAAFLWAVDPLNHAEPPPPTLPLIAADRESRITAMAWRIEAGEHWKGPGDLDLSRLKAGERIKNGRNGAVQHLGMQEPAPMCYSPADLHLWPKAIKNPTFASILRRRLEEETK